MLGIDPLVLSTFLLLAGGKTLTCPDHPPTKINIVPKTEEVEYDNTQTLAELQNQTTDTVDPYEFHGTTITQGFMKGSIGLENSIEIGKAIMKKHGAMCVWYKTITVELKIDPTIVIASELYKEPCMRKAILEHELKHVRVDREIVNKYAALMGKKLYKELKSRGFSAGPFLLENEDDVTSKMQRVVGQILELEYQKLGIERQERQRAVDSLGEYERVDEQCPSFAKKKKKLYAGLKKKS